jgi:hypothetical protein
MSGVVLCSAFASSLSAAQARLAAADWSVKSPHSLATNPPSDEDVLALVKEVIGAEDSNYTSICFSRFVDLRHADNLSLVVSVSVGRFCGLMIVDKTSQSLEIYGFQQAHYAEGPQIMDLAGNGDLELIVDTDFTDTKAGNTAWPRGR